MAVESGLMQRGNTLGVSLLWISAVEKQADEKISAGRVGVAHLSKCSMAHVCENKCFAGVPRPVASQARVSRVRGRVSAVCRWAQGRKCHRHVW